MTVKKPSWGVVCTADEPAALLLAFVAHYLDLGASEVHLYLDKANPSVRTALKRVKGCIVQRATWQCWHMVHAVNRPARHIRRQRYNAAHAYERANVDWLLHCDADEFLVPDCVFSDYLSCVPDAVDSLTVQNWERAFLRDVDTPSIFSGVFRLPAPLRKHERTALFGFAAEFTKSGFTGHMKGKALTRVGKGYQIGLHRAGFLSDNGSIWGSKNIPNLECEKARILHFDGMTALHWKVKLAKRVLSLGTGIHGKYGRTRLAQMNYVRDYMGNAVALKELHDLLQIINPNMEQALRDADLLEDYSFDPSASIKKIMPDVDIDLTVAGFDAALMKREKRAVAAIMGQDLPE